MTSAQSARLWESHDREWRHPAQVTSQWLDAGSIDPALLRFTVSGRWWETLAELRISLLITREYEHLVMAVRHDGTAPRTTVQPMPHPSGLVVDRERGTVHIASTRNPNQVHDLEPVDGGLDRGDFAAPDTAERPLVPVRSRFYPGCLYLHDLALVGAELYGNAVAHNAVVRLPADGGFERVWWPRCIETPGGPVFGQNHLQLNSIAAGDGLSSSYFSASTDRLSRRRPGHRNFPVDGRGVLFDGASREPVVRGLTRPHSARFHGGRVWIDNSGYGELGFALDGRFVAVARLPGWTRGLCFVDDIAFVGTSRVIPRFSSYAPGLDPETSRCGIHALDVTTGAVLGSLIWPLGNQVFAIDWIPSDVATGFPFRVGGRAAPRREKALFYAYTTRTVHARNKSE